MPTFSYSDFVPSKYLVRIESRELTSCQKIVWETELTEVLCYNWQEAQEVFEFTFENWKDYVRSAHSDPEYWVRTRDCFVGEWNIDVFHSNALHPRKFAVDCQVYVCFSPKDPAERDDEWGESDIWMALNHRLFTELESVYGIGTEPEPEYQPETILVPIPTWDYVETEPEPSYAVARDFEHYEFLNSEYQPEPEPAPEPDQDWEPNLITRGYLRVTVETHDKVIEGHKAFNLPYHRAEAVWQAGVYVSEIRNRITDMIGLQPETQSFNKSPYWDTYDKDRGNWCEWVCTWRADFYQGLERVTFEWGFDHDQPPFEAEEREDCTEPLWLGCITVEQPRGKRSTCSASAERSALAEWIKGSVETYALLTDYCGLDSEHIVGKHTLIEIARDGQSYRDINITLGDFVAEGIRLI